MVLLACGLPLLTSSCLTAPPPGDALPKDTQPPSVITPPTETAQAAAPIPETTQTLPADWYEFYTAVGLAPDEILPIFAEASISSARCGELPSAAKSIHSSGAQTEAEGITWLRINYQGETGWVDKAFLAYQEGDLPDELVALAQWTASNLKDHNYQNLKNIIHPEICLRFSPYPFLNESDLTFCPGDLDSLYESDSLYTWGQFDGSGEPIELSFADYHQRFIYDQDFFQPEIVGLNQEVSSGNAINNIPDIFPDGMIVEYHFPGIDPQYGGMDWRSLRLVFVQKNGIWYLAALVHGEWTI